MARLFKQLQDCPDCGVWPGCAHEPGCDSESAQTTLFSLAHALREHNHVPAMVHTDPGSGFRARLISDEVTGFAKRKGGA